jgi:hypothetical protein
MPTPEPTTRPPVQRATRTIVLPATSRLTAAWDLVATIPYGPAREQAGVADTHGGETTPFGPQFVAPGPDRVWWLLDIEKRRIARFTEDGTFIDDVAIPGRFVGLQEPFVLDGRWLLAMGGLRGEDLIADKDEARRVDFPNSTSFAPEPDGTKLPVPTNWFYSDGRTLYSDDFGNVRALTVRDRRPVARSVTSLQTPGGKRFLIRFDQAARNRLNVDLLSARKRLTLRFVGPERRSVSPIFELAADRDDRLHLFLYAAPDETQLAGYLTIDARGSVSSVEPVRDPFSPSDPGGGAHLRVIPGTVTPTLCYIDSDAVRIYERKA